MTTIKCLGKDGITREFIVTSGEDMSYDDSHEGEREITFWVKDTPDSTESFELSLREKAPGVFQIAWIGPGDQHTLRGMGIPDSLLLYAKQELKAREIRSSKTCVPGTTDRRTAEATRMWERLRKEGIAIYDATDDRYRLL